MPNQWKPISQAPKDGTRVLIYTSVGNPSTFEGVHIAEWASSDEHEERWFIPAESGFAINPSHFMFLPDPPNSEG